MNAKELAEKIVEKGQEISDEGGSSRRMINWLESLLTAALEEAIAESRKSAAFIGYEEGFREAKKFSNREMFTPKQVNEFRKQHYEDCAKIADKDLTIWGEAIAKSIRCAKDIKY